ncbi:hypothetical protein Srot_2396 [Segniliparus rotundus DSM 44985]|uniref:Lipoprotein n=1 Tax=Segniliparus rotundus (strain ATCC BAA-972 / CDC 1076 / CIP 108378 / DSM 44985 / JCM 13578) TaxID=640132 RepID=D6ZAV4_SEGRD|nr:hypothetical protein [Segniliparus rotundus]ADG98840.1 hypothetical protein Srot_2396 [Segniliparus rotundus DSM 44985]
MNARRALALLVVPLAAAGCSRAAAPQQAATTSSPAAPASSAKSGRESAMEAASAVCEVFDKTAHEIAKAEKQFTKEVPESVPLSDPQAAPKADALAKEFRDGAAKIEAAITPQLADSLAENLRSYVKIVRSFADVLERHGSNSEFDEHADAMSGAANDVNPACGIKK